MKSRHLGLAAVLLCMALSLHAAAGATTMPVLSGGGKQTLALKADASLWAWGDNDKGQLGLGEDPAQTSTPTRLGSGYRAMAAGYIHSLALKADGTLWSFGGNVAGQLGLGTADYTAHHTYSAHFTPTQVGSDTYVAVSAGQQHSLALKADGSLWAWGDNSYGQLGLGTADHQAHPVPALVGTGYVAMAAGYAHSLALKADGSLWAFGLNTFGQLGLGSADRQPHPTPAQVGTGYTALAAGSHSLALKNDGSLWAWGLNNKGQLGLGTADFDAHPTPAQVPQAAQGIGYVAVAAGSHSLALAADGSLWAWGYNYYGQLGLGDAVHRSTPTPVGSGYAAVAAGNMHSLGLKTDRTLWAWGKNTKGQLGLGNTDDQYQPQPVSWSDTPTFVPGTMLLLQ